MPLSGEPGFFTILSRDLREGRGVALRLMVSLAVGLLLSGLAVLGACLVSLGSRRGSYFYVEEETLTVCFVFAGLVYLAAMYWVWVRPARFWMRTALIALMWTAVVWAVTGLCIFWIDESFNGPTDELIVGVVLLGLSLTVGVWMPIAARFRRGRSAYHHEDGKLDVICPECGYRMVGLREAACPECGARFTLDELLASQQFDPAAGPKAAPTTPTQGRAESSSAPPPIPSADPT